MKLVIIESPYAGDVERNVQYARDACYHSVMIGEAPIASHLLYTQFLDDNIPKERRLGIAAGIAWRRVADLRAFYTDYGWSAGMLAAKVLYEKEGQPFEERKLYASVQDH